MTSVATGLAAAGTVLLAALGPGAAPAHRHPSAAPHVGRRRAAPSWFTEACRQLRWTREVDASWAAALTAGGLSVAAAAVAWSVLGAAVVAAGLLMVPRVASPALHRRRLAERDHQLPEAMERVASALRSGALLGPALLDVSARMPAPLGDELSEATARLRHGASLSAVLDRWARQPGSSPAVVLTASALGLGSQAGGEVARAVDGVAATLRERRQLQAEVRALATQARTSAWLLASAPVVFAALVAGIEPGVLRFLFGSPLGVGCLALGAGLDVIGIIWMARIVGSAS